MKYFIDGGAHVGESVRLFRSQFPNASEYKIISFEPNSDMFQSLLAEEFDDVERHAEAIWITDGYVNIYEHDDNLGFSLHPEVPNIKSTYRVVPCIDLSRWVLDHFDKNDEVILKLDIEGSEYEVLDKMIENGAIDRIDQLFIEWHAYLRQTITDAMHEQLLTKLTARGIIPVNWEASYSGSTILASSSKTAVSAIIEASQAKPASRKFFIDGGAHIGESVQLFRNQFPNASEYTIISFEPGVESQAAFDAPEFADVELHKEAIWTENGEIKLYNHLDTKNTGLSIHRNMYGMQDSYATVPCIDFSAWLLSRFTKEDTIILKLDIEGSEYEVLDKMIADGSIELINGLFMDWHSYLRTDISHERHNAIIGALANIGLDWTTWKVVWEAQAAKAAANFVPKLAVKKYFIDGGAHIGESVRLFRSQFPNAGEYKIISFEPGTESQIAFGAPEFDDVELHKEAIWIEDGEIKLYNHWDQTNTGLSIHREMRNTMDSYTVVQCVDFSQWLLSNFTKEDSIVLKFDIEGSEYEVLNKMIDDGSIDLVDCLFIEWHAYCMPSKQEVHYQLLNRLANHGVVWAEWDALGDNPQIVFPTKPVNTGPISILISSTGFWNGQDVHQIHAWSAPLANWISGYFSDDKSIPVYDFGCGMGSYINVLQHHGFDVCGFEGDPPAKAHCDKIVKQDLAVPFKVQETGNVISLEVAEHIPAQYENTFLTNITNACKNKLVVSWAVRGQDGLGHVNCLDNHEAIERIERFGMKFLPEETAAARETVKHDVLGYFYNTILVFQRVSPIKDNPPPPKSSLGTSIEALTYIRDIEINAHQYEYAKNHCIRLLELGQEQFGANRYYISLIDAEKQQSYPNQKVCAAFTLAWNETFWLWVWLSHYSKELGEENCWVLYEPGDSLIEIDRARFPKANFVECPNPYKKACHEIEFGSKRPSIESMYEYELWRCRVIREWQNKLLTDYQCCIVSDCDEVLCPPSGILNYCTSILIPSGKDRVRSACWQPIHQIDSEPAIQAISGVSILADRSKMIRWQMYDKTLLVCAPQIYCTGLHWSCGLDGDGREQDGFPGHKFRINDPIDPSLPLLHLWRVDVDQWCNTRCLAWGVTRENAEAYFHDHIPRWQGDPLIHAEGDYCPIPKELKDLIVLR